MPSKNSLLLPYSSLFRKDLSLLEGPHWISDKLIGFYMDYLEREVYKDVSVCFIRPEVTQCLKLSPNLNTFLDPIDFKLKDYAVMILNDCRDPASAGGTHWSLLVFCHEEHTFYHLDSYYGKNYPCARDLSIKIALYVGYNHSYNVINVHTLQQRNSYDCGIFVLCYLDNVLNQIAKNGKLATMEPITREKVSVKRAEFRNLIVRLHNKEVNESLENFEEKNGASIIESEERNQLSNSIIHGGENGIDEVISNYNCIETEQMEECEKEVKSKENLTKKIIKSFSDQGIENEMYNINFNDKEGNVRKTRRRRIETLKGVNKLCPNQSSDDRLKHGYKRVDYTISEFNIKPLNIFDRRKKYLQAVLLKKSKKRCTKHKVRKKRIQLVPIKTGCRIKSNLSKRYKQRCKVQDRKQRRKIIRKRVTFQKKPVYSKKIEVKCPS